MWNQEIIRIIFIFLFCGRCIFSQGSNGLSPDAQEYLNAHNVIRTQRGLPPLAWDPKLATFAQYWATQRADDCNPFRHSKQTYGENIMWELYDEYSPTRITQGWADEEKNFDLQWHKCRCQPEETAACKCGHYTQLIWRTTTRMGCGNYTCNSQKGFIVVCEYDPPGNYIGEDPFYPSDYYGPVSSAPFTATFTTTPLPPTPPTPTPTTTTPAPTMTTLTTTTTTTTLPGSTTGNMLISTRSSSGPMLAKGKQAVVARRKWRHAARMQGRKYYKKRPGWGKSG